MGAVRLTVEAPELRHYSGKDPKPLGDVEAGKVPGEHSGPAYRQIALAAWSLDAVLHQADLDATLVLALPTDPGSSLLMVYTVGERHTTTTVHTRSERTVARTERLIAENEKIRAALADRPPPLPLTRNLAFLPWPPALDPSGRPVSPARKAVPAHE